MVPCPGAVVIQHVTMWSNASTCDAITRLIGRNTRDAIRARMERFCRWNAPEEFTVARTWIPGQTISNAEWIEYVPAPRVLPNCPKECDTCSCPSR